MQYLFPLVKQSSSFIFFPPSLIEIFMIFMSSRENMTSLKLTFSLLGQNIQYPQMKGREVYFGSGFQSKVGFLQGSNGMVEGDGGGKLFMPWHLGGKE